jgi:creatinine amidohydrolase/Fe(II)-dependent formamide hydrolase-like protein
MGLLKASSLSLVIVGAMAGAVWAQAPQGRGNAPLTPEQIEQNKARELASGPEAVRPIDMLDTVWIEEQTWMETRDSIRAGKTTVIVGAGGNEQNGPYTANGKHNFVLKTTCEAIARKLGNALCAPIVTLEPGNVNAPDLRPGSVFISPQTYMAVLNDMSTSLRNMGFKNIIYISDSGGNVSGMIETAAALNARWNGQGARVFYVTEYYTQDRWSYDYLKNTLKLVQKPDIQSATRYDIHDDYHYEALVAIQNPKLLRAEARQKANRFSIYGVPLESVEKVLENGRKLAAYRADITAAAITKAISSAPPPPKTGQ